MEIKYLKLFKLKKTFRKGGFHSSPEIFWQFYLLLGFIIALGAAGFGFFLFLKIDKDPVLEANTPNAKSQVVSEERIDKSLDYFSVRSETSNQILNSPTGVIDPSL